MLKQLPSNNTLERQKRIKKTLANSSSVSDPMIPERKEENEENETDIFHQASENSPAGRYTEWKSH